MARATQPIPSQLSLHWQNQRWIVLLAGVILLLLAHGAALLFRIQPAVSLWFPPSGVAIALTLWLGPVGALLTWGVSFVVAPLWGNGGWLRLASVTDALEPLVAWFLFYRCFHGTLAPQSLRNAIAFLLSGPLLACGTSALLGTVLLASLDKLPWTSVLVLIPHWWLGNALGTMVLAPLLLLLVTHLRVGNGGASDLTTEVPALEFQALRSRRLEIGLLLGTSVLLVGLTVQATQVSVFATLQCSLLGIIPILWAIARFGVAGSVMIASFNVGLTLLAYLWVYPQALTGSAFPLSADLLYTHKLSLLMQSVIALLAGSAITERAAAQAALKVEQINRAETEARMQLNEELLQHKQELKTLVENSPDIITRFDRNLRHTYVSPAIEGLMGLPVSHFIGKTHAELGLPEELHRSWMAHIAEVFATGQPTISEFTFPLLDGSLHYYEVRILPELAADGTVQSVLGITRDVTELKQVERSLRQANERFQLASEALSSVIYDWDVRQNYIQRTNGMDRVFGYLPEDMTQNSDWYLALIHPDDLPRVLEQLKNNLAAGDRYTIEYRFRNRQGEYLYVSDQGVIIRDEIGQAIRVVGSVTDITSRATIQETLRRSEERLSLALRAANQGLYDLNVQTGEAIVSPEYARMLGYEPEEFHETNQAWRERMHPDDIPTVYRTYEEYIAGAHSEYRVEFRQRTKSGDWLWILSIGKIVEWDAQGQPLRMLGTHTDIHERKQIEVERARLLEREQAARQQAEAASRMKDEFLAIVSHELRSPLNGILGWSRLLRSRTLEPATMEKALASIERNAQAQTQLIEDLLDISRIIRGTVRLVLRPVSLIPIIQAALDTVRPTAETKTIHLHASLDSSLGLVSGDPERLQQIIWNLLSNAVKFTPEGGQVEIHLQRVGTQARIQVTDTGKGISPEFLPQVFDRFRQADATTTRTEGGLGLGLAIARSLVELHAGVIWVESAGMGQGATFSLELPLLPGESSPPLAPAAPTLAELAASLQQVRVLVVDDEADTREFLAVALEQCGATVITAASAAEALAQFQQQPPDILLSDIGMPEEDGYSLIQKIRAFPPEAGGQVPAAALTAYVRGDDRREALSAGFQLHVPKPIEPLQLLQIVFQLVEARQ